MLNYYLTKNMLVENVEAIATGCWISLISPTENEMMKVSKELNLDCDTIKSALDTDERSRIETDENYTMILINVPTVEEHNEKELYNTIPLAIILTKENVLTVCLENSPIIKQFCENKVRDFATHMKSRFVFQMLYRIASTFLLYLRIIDKKSEIVENELYISTHNKELLELLKLQKSLVYFTTALRSNESILERLLRSDILKKYPEDSDLLEDVIVENKQAIEMANIYNGILSGMADAFASIISNNLNVVMKVLAIITIVMAIPTMIFSAYGMNLSLSGMPFSQSPYGFLIIMGVSIVLSVIVAVIFIKMKMFK